MSYTVSRKLIPLAAGLALVVALPQGAVAEPHRDRGAAHHSERHHGNHDRQRARHGDRRHDDGDRHGYKDVHYRKHHRSFKRHYGHRRGHGHHKHHRRGHGHHKHHRRGYGHHKHHRHHYGYHRGHRGHHGYRHYRRHIEGIYVPHFGLHLDLNRGHSRGHITIVK